MWEKNDILLLCIYYVTRRIVIFDKKTPSFSIARNYYTEMGVRDDFLKKKGNYICADDFICHYPCNMMHNEACL